MAKDGRRIIFFSGLAIFVLALDQLLKYWIVRLNFFYAPLGDFFRISLSKNRFIAFSLPLEGKVLYFFISAIILFLVFYFLFLLKKKYYQAAGWLILVIAGALSNLFDRWRYGYVADYLDLKYCFAFNLADVLIVTGIGALILLSFKKNKKGK